MSIVERVAELAAKFTEASDRGDFASEAYDDAETDEERAQASQVSDEADNDYNRTKAALFKACRQWKGVEARPRPQGWERTVEERNALMSFYAVESLGELVDAQAKHIEKLQAKLPPIADAALQRVREG